MRRNRPQLGVKTTATHFVMGTFYHVQILISSVIKRVLPKKKKKKTLPQCSVTKQQAQSQSLNFQCSTVKLNKKPPFVRFSPRRVSHFSFPSLSCISRVLYRPNLSPRRRPCSNKVPHQGKVSFLSSPCRSFFRPSLKRWKKQPCTFPGRTLEMYR